MAPVKKIGVGAFIEFLCNGEAIGQGRVEKTSNLAYLHHSKLPAGCYAVSVLKVYDGHDAPLQHVPPMDDEINTLKKAENTVVAWPKDELV